jgi:hypothetical protein
MENKNFFKEKGYCVVKSSIDNDLRDFITQYSLFDEMRNFEADTQQVVGAHAKYADPVMETMLLKLLPLMENNTGLELDPTYSFYRVYRPGHELTVHKDRPSCEISCTLCFNYSYENSTYSWPIFMDGNKVEQLPGDLVIYRGCDLEHWRDKFDINDSEAWHVQGFFHYVDKNGPYADYKFDQRETLGLPKNQNVIQKNYIKFTK